MYRFELLSYNPCTTKITGSAASPAWTNAASRSAPATSCDTCSKSFHGVVLQESEGVWFSTTRRVRSPLATRRVLARPPSFGAAFGVSTHDQSLASVPLPSHGGAAAGNGWRLVQAVRAAIASRGVTNFIRECYPTRNPRNLSVTGINTL